MLQILLSIPRGENFANEKAANITIIRPRFLQLKKQLFIKYCITMFITGRECSNYNFVSRWYLVGLIRVQLSSCTSYRWRDFLRKENEKMHMVLCTVFCYTKYLGQILFITNIVMTCSVPSVISIGFKITS